MIDVVMATYNGGKYIKEQLDSILSQSYKGVRIIIRDDDSKDNTVEIVREYEKQYPGKIVFVSDNIRCGSSRSNFMQALKYSTAEYVMCSDQDDVWLHDKVLHSLNRMLEIENKIGKDKPILVFGSYKPVDERLNDITDNIKNRQEATYKLNFSNLLVQNYVNGCLMMMNRSLADAMGDYDDRILMHDWWAALIASGCGAIEHIDEIMMLYRQHKKNVVGSVNVKSFKYRIKKVLDTKTKEAPRLYLEQAKLMYERERNRLLNLHKDELVSFIELYNKNKVGRILGLIRGKYFKSDFVRILGQIYYI